MTDAPEPTESEQATAQSAPTPAVGDEALAAGDEGQAGDVGQAGAGRPAGGGRPASDGKVAEEGVVGAAEVGGI